MQLADISLNEKIISVKEQILLQEEVQAYFVLQNQYKLQNSSIVFFL